MNLQELVQEYIKIGYTDENASLERSNGLTKKM